MRIKEINIVNGIEDILKELEFPCFIKLKYDGTSSRYGKKGFEISFEQWEGSWLFENENNILADNHYSVSGYIENTNLTNKIVFLHIPNEEEYYQIVLKRGGKIGHKILNIDSFGWHFDHQPPTKEEAINYYHQIKDKQNENIQN